jgi:hypothetical protein
MQINCDNFLINSFVFDAQKGINHRTLTLPESISYQLAPMSNYQSATFFFKRIWDWLLRVGVD